MRGHSARRAARAASSSALGVADVVSDAVDVVDVAGSVAVAVAVGPSLFSFDGEISQLSDCVCGEGVTVN